MASQPQPDQQELVEVFDTDQESEAMVVRGLLESAGIDAIQTGLDAPPGHSARRWRSSAPCSCLTGRRCPRVDRGVPCRRHGRR